jgi:hypothetical protein
MITTIYNLSQKLQRNSSKHARLGNTLRMKAYYYASDALLEVKTFLQSL